MKNNKNRIINELSNLKKIRESKNITQTKLSTDLGVSQELISRYEIGSSFPQTQMLIQLANYFNCSTDYLLGQTDISTPIKYFSNDSDNLKATELYNKYNSLSPEDNIYFDRFLSFLLDNTNNSNE